MRDWKRTDSVETEKFLGLLLMMSILKKPLIAQYWSKNPLYSTPLFGLVMSRNRFQLLLSMLHFNDSTQQPSRDDPLQDKLFKLRPVVDHLFEHFQLTYSMSQNVCIDESLQLWKGCLHFKQCIPIKRSRFGVKSFKLCESNGRYIYRFRIYVGKDNLLQFPPGIPQPPIQFGPKLNAMCGSWCCQFWRKDIISTWTISTSDDPLQKYGHTLIH